MEKQKVLKKLENMRAMNIEKKIENEILNCIDDIEYSNVKTRIKSDESTIKKMQLTNKNADEIKDLFGMIVVTDNKDDVYEVVKKIVMKNPIADVENYIKYPKNGYKSIHVNFEKNINNQKIPVEIQVKTKEMYKNQNIVHDKIYKNYKIPTSFRGLLSKVAFKTLEKVDNLKKKVSSDDIYKLNEYLK